MSVNYNEENVKKILESEKVPERLEPENIKKLLDDTNAAGRRKKIRHGKMLRIVSAAAAFALVIGTSAYFLKPAVFSTDNFIKNTNIKASASVESMRPAVKYSDIYSYFHAASNFNKFSDLISGALNGGYKRFSSVMEDGGLIGGEDLDDMLYGGEYADEAQLDGAAENFDLPAVNTSSIQKKEYSDTYNQEEGVLEADVVKTDGERIFYASSDTISMAKVDSGKFTKSYKTDISTLLGKKDEDIIFYLNDMYIYSNKLILICSANNYKPITKSVVSDCFVSEDGGDTYVLTASIGDQLTLDGYYIQDGSYNDVRLMANGYMYLVTNDSKELDFKKTTEEDIGTYIPEYCVNGECDYVPADDIMIPREKLREVYDYVSYVNLAGLDLNGDTPWQPVDMKSIAGYSNNIYCSQKNLYIVCGYEETEITRFSLENGMIDIMASGKVKGYVIDQFSMSEYNEYFRIAVTEIDAIATTINNAVYVLGMDMEVVGSISDFGINEHIKSANFNGDMAYVVTFRNTDPLFAIDLSDPANPKLLDELKISGYSTYMQKWSDGLLLGFGAEADENSGGVTGVKLTMFDNSDPENLKAVDYVSITGSKDIIVFGEGESDYIEEYVSSEGTYERKALYIDPERNIIGFPIQRNHYHYAYNDIIFNGIEYDYDGIEKQNDVSSYMFYSFEDGRLVFKGELKKEYDVENSENENFRRAVYIDGYLYVVSADMFKSADAVTFKQVDSLKNF